MFVEDYEKLSRGERTQFSETLNDLLYQCFIVRRNYDKKSKMFKAEPDYLFIERHYSMFEDYLSYMGMVLVKDDEDGVIFLTSEIEKNHLRLDTVTTLIVYALRSYYEEQISKAPEDTTPMMTSGALNMLLVELGLSNASKRISSSTIASSLRELDTFNVVSRANGTYGDPSYSFFILPTIRYVISSEKMNSLYSFLEGNDEESDSDSQLFEPVASEEKVEESDKPYDVTQNDIPVVFDEEE